MEKTHQHSQVEGHLGLRAPPVKTLCNLHPRVFRLVTYTEVQKSESTFQIEGVVLDFVCHEIIPLKESLCSEDFEVKPLKCMKRGL